VPLLAKEIQELIKVTKAGNSIMIARWAQALASDVNGTKPCCNRAGNVVRQVVANEDNPVSG
jgi:hypothetical protein